MKARFTAFFISSNFVSFKNCCKAAPVKMAEEFSSTTNQNIDSCLSRNCAEISLQDRIKGSLIGFFSGDALAMPVHWYYDVRQLFHDFPGGIRKYESPKSSFPGSIMNLSNTGGGGRGNDSGDIVGDVILHGKKKFWLRGGNFHYHHGMMPGENTLDALVTRLLVQSIIRKGMFDPDDFRNSYISFMTTPDSHNDIYAGTCHRMFFANWKNGVDPEQCPGNDGHNVDAIDALMIVPPITIAHVFSSKEVRYEAVKKSIQVTRKTSAVLEQAYIYSDMLTSLLTENTSIRDVASVAASAIGIDIASEVARSRKDPMTACYIDSSFPAMLFFAYKYGDNVEAMLLASTNAGGENVARGSLLGALAGAWIGYSSFPAHLRDGLVFSESYSLEADAFSDLILPNQR